MNLPGFFYYLTHIQYTKYTKHAVFDPLNHLFKLIKLFPELLKFVTVRADKRQSLYLYTGEGSYKPLARIDRNSNQKQHIYYFHTDVNCIQEELTDEDGEIFRGCSYQLWGKPIQEIAHRDIQQNLQYQDNI